MPDRLVLPHGGYRRLRSYQVAEVVYDATVKFCDRFVDRRSRTHDQMVQAARSGKQNIAEGSRASGTSRKTELKLVNVARASLEELLLDYQDFIRQRGLPAWGKDHPKAQEVRALGRADRSDRTDRTDRTDPGFARYRAYFEEGTPEVAANTAICLIHQANYLLDQQIRALERQFLEEGGFTERMCRLRAKSRSGGSD
jgi:four helix bundle suffix protein